MTLPLTHFLHDEAATLALGRALASGLEPGMVVFLSGDLGAGKTTLARGVLQGFDYTGKVKSPTFTLVEPYDLSRLHLYHFDFYRLNMDKLRADEAEEAGFREYFNDRSVCLVEWPERAGKHLLRPDLTIRLDEQGAGRRAVITAQTEAGDRCIERLRET